MQDSAAAQPTQPVPAPLSAGPAVRSTLGFRAKSSKFGSGQRFSGRGAVRAAGTAAPQMTPAQVQSADANRERQREETEIQAPSVPLSLSATARLPDASSQFANVHSQQRSAQKSGGLSTLARGLQRQTETHRDTHRSPQCSQQGSPTHRQTETHSDTRRLGGLSSLARGLGGWSRSQMLSPASA